MPSLKAIRTRIASVKNTQKITRAMKLVAAARLRRAQDAMVAARPYARRLSGVVADIAARLEVQGEDQPAHPLLTRRDIKTVRVIVVGSDRGLAGGFNSNLNRRVERFMVDEKGKYTKIELVTVGRKAREHFRRRRPDALVKDYPGVASDVAMERARTLAHDAAQAFLAGEVDGIFVAFNEFKSAISQEVRIERLLPLQGSPMEAGANRIDFEYEPTKEDLLATILPLYLETELFRVMLESIASEFGARMSAMDNA